MLGRLWTRFWSRAGGVSILAKIMGIVLLVVLAQGLAVAWYVKTNVASTLEGELELRGTAIAMGLATRAADQILTDNLFELHRVAQDTLRADGDVRYVFIEDAKGRVLVHTFGSGFPVALLGINQPKGSSPQAVKLSTEEGRLVDVAVPVLNGEAGSVHVGMSTADVGAAIGKNTEFILLIATPLVLVPGLALAYLLATIISRALRGVVRAADAVGRGDFAQPAPIWARDEIGHLAVAFNEMRDRLGASHQQLLRRHRELSLLNATARAASSSLTLDDVLRGALEKICESMEMQIAHVCILGQSKGLISFVYLHNPRPTLIREGTYQGPSACPCAEELAGSPYVEGAPSQPCPVADGKASDHFPSAQPCICLPLRAKKRLLGVMHLARRGDSPIAPEDIQLLTGVSEQLAVAVENAGLWEDLKEREAVKGQLLEKIIVAQEEERRRVAQELHDEAGQALTALLVELRALELTDPRDGLEARVAELRALVADSLRIVQNIALELRPSMLDDMGLLPALRRYIQTYADRYGLRVDFQTSGVEELRLQQAAETTIYRILQEALTNVARHASASSVSVVLTQRDHQLVGIVEDDGRGFDVGQALGRREASLGIAGMQERASLVGGRLAVESRPGEGTTVFVEVPLDANVVGGGFGE